MARVADAMPEQSVAVGPDAPAGKVPVLPPPVQARAAVRAEPPKDEERFPALFKVWFEEVGYWYLTSLLVHMIGFLLLGVLFMLLPHDRMLTSEAPSFDEADTPAHHIDDIGFTPVENAVLNTEVLTESLPAAQTAKFYDKSEEFEDAGGGHKDVVQAKGANFGGMGGASMRGLAGPGGLGGAGYGKGEGDTAGVGGASDGFGLRGKGHQDGQEGLVGNTKGVDRAVVAALDWLYRHQCPKGNWSLQYEQLCKGDVCRGNGSIRADSAATAMGLLPFFAAGQTHRSKGPYQPNIARGISWLVKQQRRDGDLSGSADQPMYSHALATIALCEAYGMSKDEYLRSPAQRAVTFIEKAQHPTTGGWRYQPGDTGDTSSVGWQVMALKSAQMAHLAVQTSVLEKVHSWLASVAKGEHKGLFAYLPYQDALPSTTAIGLLCTEYLGAGREDPALVEGRTYLLQNSPSSPNTDRDSYYFYYASLAMHNFLGPEWDQWNRPMRRLLIQLQEKQHGCAMGSWDPDKPTEDKWGALGGRLMTTSFSTLTLEVYYRYTPLFNVTVSPGEIPKAAAEAEKKDTADKPEATEKKVELPKKEIKNF
jgi:hypothetical protein